MDIVTSSAAASNTGSAQSQSIAQARQAVAEHFLAIDKPHLARIVLDGQGDDFDEVQLAASVLAKQAGTIARYQDALHQYADHGFWDDALPGGPLALHDAGEMARNVLAGRTAFFHGD
ncbi:hypothetical protein [Croceicoccus pelagius]|uniref:Uncharacterized protein n=1 Tax=Croceicoccus pelagius TaxID=1703341 RepID=A0A917DKP0_9SPHN|nr:hypothetical protein [Croceicoccus pelagius]GGD43863.1 hypothetical protein GCM10010989_17530 [Croceicoccus pelagius]